VPVDFSAKRGINVSNSEDRQLSWGVPLDGNVDVEVVVILPAGAAVR
jgi:hypothetical protein